MDRHNEGTKGSGKRKTLLFLRAGPHFPVDLKSTRASYELLSRKFEGFIMSFVYCRHRSRATIGEFQLSGLFVPSWLYASQLLRVAVRFWFLVLNGIRLHFFKKPIDVVVAYDPFMTGFAAYVISKIIGARLVVEVHGDYYEALHWNSRGSKYIYFLKWAYVQRMIPFVLNRANAVKLLHENQLRGFCGIKGRQQFKTFHDFVPISNFSPGRNGAKIILFVGHPWHTKGVDILVEAFIAISPGFPDVRLRLVGHLPEKERTGRLFRDKDKIEFVRPVPADEVPALMRECTVFVLPSRSEAMGRVLLEAMATRKPLIASRVGGIPEYITHGETGLLFEREDVAGLAKLLRKVLSDEKYAERLAENGYNLVHSRLSENAYYENYVNLIAEACT